MTVQGDIEITVYDTIFREKETRQFRDQDDFTTALNDANDLDDFEVIGIYTRESFPVSTWLCIDVQEPEQ
jgi:hypothetical protein